MKIKDRLVLGMIAGIGGDIVKTAIDEVSIKKKISQRSFREAAAGGWVSKKQASSLKGQILGGMLDAGMSSIAGMGIVHLLSKTGRDHIILKGIITGVAVGSGLTLLLSALPENKAKPKDAASNLSYMFAHALFGITAAVIASNLGHPSIYDAKPVNDYLKPTEQTTEQNKEKTALSKQNEVANYQVNLNPS